MRGNNRVNILRLLTVILMLASTPSAKPLSAKQLPVELLPTSCESDLALSAAPAHLRADASLYVLEEQGYRKARAGSNGFSCIVNRDHPRVLKPTCFDRQGAATIVPKILEFGRLLMAGKSVEQISAHIDAGFADGTFKSPGPGVAYMMSRYNRPYDPATDTLGWFPPHVMFYAPNLTPEDIGFQMEAWHENQQLPFIGYQGPHGYMISLADDGAERSRSDLTGCPDWVHTDS